jgi:hypothetical protein
VRHPRVDLDQLTTPVQLHRVRIGAGSDALADQLTGRKAAAHGPHVGAYAAAVLEHPLPWTKVRQVYRLLGLVRRHGADAVEDACRRALDAEVIDVGLIERILTRNGGEQLPLLPKPPTQASRFVRHSSDFAVRRPS